MKEWSEQFYKSDAWKNARDNHFRKAKGLCEDCLKRGLIVPGEEVHHITFLTPENINNPDITLNDNNLVLLCRECHRARHKCERRYKVDEFGRVSPPSERK